MATLSPYVGLSVDTGVTLDPAGLTAGDGGLTLEPQVVEKFALFPGSSGDNFSTPGVSANDFIDDLDFRFDMQLDDWGSGSLQNCLGKIGGGDDAYLFGATNDEKLRFLASTTGSLNISTTSSDVTGFADGSRHWIRVTRLSTTGAITYFTSEDGENFTQLGSIQPGTAGTIFLSTQTVFIGSGNSGDTNVVNGRIYRALLMNGINGTVAVDFNPNDYEEGINFTSSTTNEVWTLNGNVSIEEE